MKTKKQSFSVADKIMKVIGGRPKNAEEMQKELKDKFGFSIELQDIRVNLLYLLRREKIRREKDGAFYKYYI